MSTLFLSVAHTALIALFCVALACAGMLVWVPDRRSDLPGRVLGALICFGLGWGLVAFLAPLLGLVGLFRPWALLSVLAVLAAVGAWRARNWVRHPLEWRSKSRTLWSRLEGFQRPCAVVVLAVMGLISLNVWIGGLAPDVSWQALQADLSLPGQWLLSGHLTVFPYVPESASLAAGQAVMAAVLPLGGAVAGPALCSAAALMALWVFPLAAWRTGRAAGAILLAAIVPALWMLWGATAPLGVTFEPLASLLMFLGLWVLIEPLLAPGPGASPTIGRGIAAGLLWGTAAATAPVTLLFSSAFLLVFAIWAATGKHAGLLKVLAVATGTMALAMAPWLLRAGLATGNPVIFALPQAFPVHEEFLPMAKALASRPPLFGFSLAATLSQKLEASIRTFDAFLVMMPLAALFALAEKRPAWRAVGAGLMLCAVLAILLGKGTGGEFRAQGLAYLLAAPALGIMFLRIAEVLREQLWALAFAVLIAGAAMTAGKRQLERAAYPDVQWPFHPIVTESAMGEWTRHQPFGQQLTHGIAVQAWMPADARLLLVDAPGPFYLERRAVWTSRGMTLEFGRDWPGQPATAVAADLRARGISHIVVTQPQAMPARVLEMERAGLLRRATVPAEAAPWVLWELEGSRR
ncbi:MAG: hypothetical protein RLY93_20175 [Sumerlaeia bacterium]